jgi:hypothetical protein
MYYDIINLSHFGKNGRREKTPPEQSDGIQTEIEWGKYTIVTRYCM